MFPKKSTIRFDFGPIGNMPALKLFWYDGLKEAPKVPGVPEGEFLGDLPSAPAAAAGGRAAGARRRGRAGGRRRAVPAAAAAGWRPGSFQLGRIPGQCSPAGPLRPAPPMAASS